MDTKPTSCFVLDDKNLANYRTWLKTVREKARSERGRLTELHLIGEEVPVEDATAEDPAVSGELASSATGADGKRRRCIKHPDQYPEGQERDAAVTAYGERSIFSLGVKAIANMTEAARERVIQNYGMQVASYHEREDYLCDLLNQYTRGKPSRSSSKKSKCWRSLSLSKMRQPEPKHHS